MSFSSSHDSSKPSFRAMSRSFSGDLPSTSSSVISTEEFSEELLFCPICMDQFVDPRRLICDHTFCMKCLDRMYSHISGKISCPTCRMDTPLPRRRSLQQLPVNRFMIQVIDFVTSRQQKAIDAQIEQNNSRFSIPCTHCEDSTVAIAKCSDCSEYLCEFHQKTHARAHSIITFYRDNQFDPSIVSEFDWCKEHPTSTYQMFCEECDQLVCSDCLTGNHSRHTLNKIESIAVDEKERLTQLVSKIDVPLNEIRLTIEGLTKLRHASDSHHIRTTEKFNEYLDHQILRLRTQGQQILNNVQDEVTRHRGNILDRIAELHDLQISMETLQASMRSAIDTASDIRLIQVRQESEVTYNKLSGSSRDIGGTINDDFEFLMETAPLKQRAIDRIASITILQRPDPDLSSLEHSRSFFEIEPSKYLSLFGINSSPDENQYSLSRGKAVDVAMILRNRHSNLCVLPLETFDISFQDVEKGDDSPFVGVTNENSPISLLKMINHNDGRYTFRFKFHRVGTFRPKILIAGEPFFSEQLTVEPASDNNDDDDTAVSSCSTSGSISAVSDINIVNQNFPFVSRLPLIMSENGLQPKRHAPLYIVHESKPIPDAAFKLTLSFSMLMIAIVLGYFLYSYHIFDYADDGNNSSTIPAFNQNIADIQRTSEQHDVKQPIQISSFAKNTHMENEVFSKIESDTTKKFNLIQKIKNVLYFWKTENGDKSEGLQQSDDVVNDRGAADVNQNGGDFFPTRSSSIHDDHASSDNVRKSSDKNKVVSDVEGKEKLVNKKIVTDESVQSSSSPSVVVVSDEPTTRNPTGKFVDLIFDARDWFGEWWYYGRKKEKE